MSVFKKIENKWSQDSSGYDNLVRLQLEDKRKVNCWVNELDQVLGRRPLRILEVGCGPGFLSILLTKMGHQVKAIDGAEGMLKAARANFKRYHVEVESELEDGVTLEAEKDNTYDVIISRDVVWTLYDPEAAFARWKEVLKPGGQVVYYDGNYQTVKKTLKNFLWMRLSEILIFVTEHIIYPKDAEETSGVFAELPMVKADRPEADCRLLKEAGFCGVRSGEGRWQNDPLSMDFWKYGYQGRKFRVTAWKELPV
ncbi:MAG: class I SAM-dependent methyltransferase [Eubacteriales bacterium]|nr:class I SAM-dependent methyltransferase [Eubacteriales bacterium]